MGLIKRLRARIARVAWRTLFAYTLSAIGAYYFLRGVSAIYPPAHDILMGLCIFAFGAFVLDVDGRRK